MKSSTKIAGIEFESCVINASGPRDTTLTELQILGASQSAAIMMKSCTLEARAGNPEPRYAQLAHGSIQSMGLPNLGYKKYLEIAPQLQVFAKPVIASVSGLNHADYPQMVAEFQKSTVDLIEVNLSCPNIVGKPQLAYDFEATEKVLQSLVNLGNKPLGVKLPAYFESIYFEQMAALIKRYEIRFISAINSIGNTLVIDPVTETPLIKPKNGFGGLGGEYIKPIALANVRNFYQLLGDEVAVFGVGGVKSGLDAFEFILAGASAVQVATQFEIEGSSCFARIIAELHDIMDSRGYSCLDDFRGKLKAL